MLEDATVEIYALVSDGLVVNLVLWDGEDAEFAQALQPSLLVAIPEGMTVAIGDAHDGTAFVPAAVPAAPQASAPQIVTMRQARLALLAAGHLAAVGEAIAALPAAQKEAAQIEWEFAATVERSSPVVELLSSALNLSAAQLDALFLEASQL